jgi:Leucine-rich repeat (LRR) protein
VTERELLDLIARARDEEWKELNLSYKRISVIPDSIGQLSNLRILYLRNNKIEVIPESLIKVEKITQLKIFFTDN